VVTVPSTVTIPAGAASAGFAATVSSVATAQAVTMTASTKGMFTSFTLQLNAAILALSINATSVSFGDVVVNIPKTQSVTMTSTGTVPVTINGATLTGASFTVSGVDFPATLSPNQEATLNLEFDPTAAEPATGQLTIASNASTNGTALIALTGTGTTAPVVAVTVTPASASITTGATQQFAASVTGSSNTAVTWTVSGAGCSGAACGTISSAGLYTAPSTSPTPSTVTVTATSASDTTKSASASVTVLPLPGATYYLAPASAGGNDSNNGLSPSAPWLTPKHPVNCGDTLIAQAGSYTTAFTNFGTVTCPARNNVAWLECATPFGCLMSIANNYDMFIYTSYWGVQGWVLSNSGTNTTYKCISVSGNGANFSHVIIANNIIRGCQADGIGFGGYNGYGPDYVAILGNIIYNAGQSNANGYAGISSGSPIASDTSTGTHIYVAGNFVWGTEIDSCCDNEGIVLDTISYYSYAQQIAAENNLTTFNGGGGVTVAGGGNAYAPIYLVHNTAVYNNQNPDQGNYNCAEILLASNNSTPVAYSQAYLNLVDVKSGTSAYCNGAPVYGLAIRGGNGTDSMYDNFVYSLGGSSTNALNSAGFSFSATNVFGVNPSLSGPTEPPAPSCSSYTTTTACMASVIASFTPTASAAIGFGYQTVTSTPNYNPLFPQWLCGVPALPSGIVTMGCLSAPQ
jgi:hypothetical protein